MRTNATDPDSDEVTISVIRITSDEPTASDPGSGGNKHSPDVYGLVTNTAYLRSEKTGNGNGRVYEITFVASDGRDGETTGSINVYVPRDVREGVIGCIDDGQFYDATEAMFTQSSKVFTKY